MHSRLSIIDPKGQCQPISDDNEKIYLVFNGEIYNHKKLTALAKRLQTEEASDVLALDFAKQHAVTAQLTKVFKGAQTEIARALATNPNFILLDEPFAGVDPLAVEDIQKIVRDLTKKNIGILITDHNVQETLAITDRTYLMFEGKILRHGSPEDLANDEMVRKVEDLKKQNIKIDNQSITEVLTVNGVRFSLTDGSWGLIRASSNKPSLVVVTESPTSNERKKNIFDFIDKLLQGTGKIGEYDQKIN